MIVTQNIYGQIQDKANSFLEDDRPSFSDLTIGDSATGQFSFPWNYDKSWNENRTYPLVVLIGGSGSVGSSTSDLFNNELPPQFWTGTYQQSDQWQEYPCFIYISHPDQYYDDEVAGHDVATIEYIKENYRVDEDRVYILGYSMGGSGTHYLANNYYTSYGAGNIAAISRLVGYLELSIDDDSIDCWYHIGLDDNSTWVTAVQTAYSNFKTARSGGVEQESTSEVNGYSALTKTYVYDSSIPGKYTEYTGVDHSVILDTVYENPEVLRWIFSKRSNS